MLELRAAQLTNKLPLACVHNDYSIDSYSIHVTFTVHHQQPPRNALGSAWRSAARTILFSRRNNTLQLSMEVRFEKISYRHDSRRAVFDIPTVPGDKDARLFMSNWNRVDEYSEASAIKSPPNDRIHHRTCRKRWLKR